MQSSDDHDPFDGYQQADDQQSYGNKSEYDCAESPATPSPQYNHNKRRHSALTGDDIVQRRPSPVAQHHPTPTTQPVRTRPPAQTTASRSSLKPCEAELVDGFCNYLAMQLKRLSAHMFLDVQMDLQKIVLQAQRYGLSIGMGGDEKFVDPVVKEPGRMTNGGCDGQKQPQQQQPQQKEDGQRCGNEEVEWEDCPIKSEPIDDDVDEYIERIPPTAIPDAPLTIQSLPLIVDPDPPATQFPQLSTPAVIPLEPTVHIDLIQTPSPPSYPSPASIPPPATPNGASQIEQSSQRLNHAVQNLISQPPLSTPPQPPSTLTAFDGPSAAAQFVADPGHKPIPKDGAVYSDIACAVGTLSGAVGTLSTALTGLHLYFSHGKTT